MGKRELLLIVAFAIVGAIVYQATAPAPAPGERSFSPTQIIDNIRRGVRGNRASAESVNTRIDPVDRAITDLEVVWLKGSAVELTIIGEAREDISSDLRVHSNAFDDAEAERTAKATVLKVERGGMRLVASIDFPSEGRQTAYLTLHVPARLLVKATPARGRTRISAVAGVELEGGRGDTEISQVSGRVAGSYRSGDLRVTGAGAVKFTTVAADVRLEQIAGGTSLNMRAGNLKAADLAGPIDIDATNVDIELEKLEKTTGMVRITATAGSVSVKGLRTEARIDARNSDVDAVLEGAAPLAIYSEAGSRVDITAPPGGYQLDAVASDGDISVPEATVQVTANGQEHRATGAVKGGGPTITIRTAHGDITLRARAGTERTGDNGEKRSR